MNFVRSYAAATGKPEVIARWFNPDLRQAGDGPDGATRQPPSGRGSRRWVRQWASSHLGPTGCTDGPNIEIGFTTEPQSML